MDVSHLIRVHEAGIAHHVAAICQIDRQHGASAMLDGAAAMVMQTLIGMGRDIASGEVLLDPLEELHINRHQVFGFAVLRAVFDHPDLAIALDDRGLNFAHLLMEQLCPVGCAADDGFAGFFDAFRTEGVGLARPSEDGFGLLPGLQ